MIINYLLRYFFQLENYNSPKIKYAEENLCWGYTKYTVYCCCLGLKTCLSIKESREWKTDRQTSDTPLLLLKSHKLLNMPSVNH